MKMDFQLFSFIEGHHDDIVAALKSEMAESRPAFKEISDESLGRLMEQIFEGYADLLVTGETNSLDKLYGALSRLLAARGAAFSGLFEIPLALGTVIRRQLAEEFADLDAQDKLDEFNKSLETTEATAIKAACRFLDVFHEYLERRIEQHNRYLAHAASESGIDLSSFRITAAGD
jgi:hypothetical protein